MFIALDSMRPSSIRKSQNINHQLKYYFGIENLYSEELWSKSLLMILIYSKIIIFEVAVAFNLSTLFI